MGANLDETGGLASVDSRLAPWPSLALSEPVRVYLHDDVINVCFLSQKVSSFYVWHLGA